MKDRLMGIETEYAFSVAPRQGKSLDRLDLLHRMLGAVRERFPSIPDFYTGMFLPNGARLYLDTGLHPEYATPECMSPEETVAYILAGDRILRDIAVSLEQGCSDIKEVLLFRTNIDYGGTYATWGCHESYLHSVDPAVLAPQIIPHLVSRLIYTGAGGFNPVSKGMEFSISPRVAHLKHVSSAESTHNRGIFHTKNETLAARGYNRLHVLCGESLCSHTANWLKIGTTALVVAMIEAGVCQADAVRLSSPLQAMQAFAADPGCRASAALTSGRRATAIEIQHHYLSRAEASLGADFMPDWAERICKCWRRVLNALSAAAESLDGTLDWAMKQAVFADSAGRLGLNWELIPHWSYVAARLKEALAKTEYHDRPVTAEFVLSSSSPVRKEVEALTPHLAEAGLRWDDLAHYARVKWRLCEIDLRFGQLSEGSVFTALDRAGVLSHRIDGMREPSAAVNEPPARGRARLRGEFVRSHGKENGHYFCDWQGVWDYRKRRVLDLSDPFETEERWREFNQNEAQWPWNPGTGVPRYLHRRSGIV